MNSSPFWSIIIWRRAQSVLPHQEETALPSTPPQQPPEEITDVVPIVPLMGPVGTIASDAEGPRSHRATKNPSVKACALTTTATRLMRALKYAPVETFDHPDTIASYRTSGGRKCTSAVRGLPQTWGAPPYVGVGEGNTLMPDLTNDVMALGLLLASCQAPDRCNPLSLSRVNRSWKSLRSLECQSSTPPQIRQDM
ncbi:hypothetical protein ACLOJK_006696 [Asimina triloba]